MKRLTWATAAGALLLAGCGDDAGKVKYDDEAIKFGYKGVDTEVAEPMYFSTGPTVTNWVPARVLSVCEKYDLSPEEQKLVAAAGVINPGDEFAEVPAGYAKQDEEPWFSTWTKPNAAFGLEGVAGFLSHYDEDRRVWSTSEAYFSSYWKTEAEALAALARLRAAVAEGYGAKKFYDFDKSWVAEYLRLRVMAVVGQKADGRWSCMLDVQDKNRAGCGQWEPVAEQQERRNHYEYNKAMKAWRAALAKTLADNHARIAKSLADAGLPGFPEQPAWQTTEFAQGKPCVVGVLEGAFTNSLDEAWVEKVGLIESAIGVKVAQLAAVEAEGETAAAEETPYRAGTAQDARYDVRLDMALVPEPPAPEPLPAEGEAAPAEGAPAEAPAPRLRGQWRILCVERLQPGFELPARPTLRK